MINDLDTRMTMTARKSLLDDNSYKIEREGYALFYISMGSYRAKVLK